LGGCFKWKVGLKGVRGGGEKKERKKNASHPVPKPTEKNKTWRLQKPSHPRRARGRVWSRGDGSKPRKFGVRAPVGGKLRDPLEQKPRRTGSGPENRRRSPCKGRTVRPPSQKRGEEGDHRLIETGVTDGGETPLGAQKRRTAILPWLKPTIKSRTEGSRKGGGVK